MDDEEIQHLLKVRKATQARIWVLEECKAERGELDTGHAVELQQAREDMHILDAKLSASGPSARVSELVPDAAILLLDHKVKALGERLDDAMTFITHHFEGLLERQERDAEARAEGQARNAKEQQRIWFVIALLAIAVCVLILTIAR